MRLLLADDEPSIRRLYTQMLEGNGFDVQVATDGQETLDAAVGGSFDLIILDLKMPRLDGFEVLRALRKADNDVPVVVMTGHFPADVVSSRIEEFGVAEVLMKPVMITDLLNAVRRVVGPDQPG